MATISKLQKLWSFIVSLVMIGCGILLLFDPEDSVELVAFFLGFALVVSGVRRFFYYLTMARHMAGGLSLLFIAVIAIDIGSLALLLAFIGNPRMAIVIFLVCYNLYTGVIAIARGIEAKMFESHWVLSVLHGLVNIALAVLCLAFIGSAQIVITIFCICLFYSAAVRLISVFRRTEIIYIQ